MVLSSRPQQVSGCLLFSWICFGFNKMWEFLLGYSSFPPSQTSTPLNVPCLKIQSNNFLLLFFQSGSSYFWNTVTNQVSWLHPLGNQIQAIPVLFEICCFPMQISQSAKFRYLFISDPAAEITLSASAPSSQKGQFIIPKFCILMRFKFSLYKESKAGISSISPPWICTS